MHQTRPSTTTKLPISRKGTKYVARASSHLHNSVPVVIAVRDMLHLAKTAREVNEMVKGKMLKVNGKTVHDYHQSICLFNILEADKHYSLSLLPTGKFVLEKTTHKEGRVCKVVNKRLLSKGAIQLNLHDGTNVITKEKGITVGDSVYLDASNAVKKHVTLAKGKEVFVISGRHKGQKGKISAVSKTGLTISHNGADATLAKEAVVVL